MEAPVRLVGGVHLFPANENMLAIQGDSQEMTRMVN